MFLVNFHFIAPIDSLLRTIFHISDISVTIPSNSDCKINKIKGMKPCNSAQSSLDAQDNRTQDDQLSSTNIQVFYLLFYSKTS